MTTSFHLRLAMDSLDEATIHFYDAVRSGEFAGYSAWYLDRLAVLKRGSADLTKKIRERADKDELQEELVFG